MTSQAILTYSLDKSSRDDICALLDEIATLGAGSAAYQTESHVLAQLPRLIARIPHDLLAFLIGFARIQSTEKIAHIRNIPMRSIDSMPTPSQHGARSYAPTEDHILAILLASVVGNPVGYGSQQDGRIVNDIMPIRGRGGVANSSNGFDHKFGYHTEDAFLTVPPSFFTLRCIRDPAGLGATLAPLNVSKLSPGHVSDLSLAHFQIRPNPSQIEWAEAGAIFKPILFGDARNPCLRFNEADTISRTTNGHRAIEALVEHLNCEAIRLEMMPGDMVFVDNYRVAHARESYSPRLDGTDRWMLRIVAFESLRQMMPSSEGVIQDGVLYPRRNSK